MIEAKDLEVAKSIMRLVNSGALIVPGLEFNKLKTPTHKTREQVGDEMFNTWFDKHHEYLARQFGMDPEEFVQPIPEDVSSKSLEELQSIEGRCIDQDKLEQADEIMNRQVISPNAKPMPTDTIGAHIEAQKINVDTLEATIDELERSFKNILGRDNYYHLESILNGESLKRLKALVKTVSDVMPMDELTAEKRQIDAMLDEHQKSEEQTVEYRDCRISDAHIKRMMVGMKLRQRHDFTAELMEQNPDRTDWPECVTKIIELNYANDDRWEASQAQSSLRVAGKIKPSTYTVMTEFGLDESNQSMLNEFAAFLSRYEIETGGFGELNFEEMGRYIDKDRQKPTQA